MVALFYGKEEIMNFEKISEKEGYRYEDLSEEHVLSKLL